MTRCRSAFFGARISNWRSNNTLKFHSNKSLTLARKKCPKVTHDLLLWIKLCSKKKEKRIWQETKKDWLCQTKVALLVLWHQYKICAQPMHLAFYAVLMCSLPSRERICNTGWPHYRWLAKKILFSKHRGRLIRYNSFTWLGYDINLNQLKCV